MASFPPQARGVLWAQLNALLGGTMMAAGMLVTGEHLPHPLEPQRFTALMYLIAAPVNTVWWALTHAGVVTKLHAAGSGRAKPFTVKGTLWLLAHTAASVVGITGLWEGLSRSSAAVGSLLSRIEVVVAIILGLVLLRERFTRNHWLGFLLTASGLALVRWTILKGEPVAFAYLLLGAIAFGIAEFTGKVAVAYTPVPRLVLVRSWLMLAALTAIWWIRVPGWPELTMNQWGWLTASALLGPFASRNCYMLSLSYLPVSTVVLLTQVQPLYAAIVGFLLQGTVPEYQFYLGAVAIIMGNALLVSAINGKRERARAKSQAQDG